MRSLVMNHFSQYINQLLVNTWISWSHHLLPLPHDELYTHTHNYKDIEASNYCSHMHTHTAYMYTHTYPHVYTQWSTYVDIRVETNSWIFQSFETEVTFKVFIYIQTLSYAPANTIFGENGAFKLLSELSGTGSSSRKEGLARCN